MIVESGCFFNALLHNCKASFGVAESSASVIRVSGRTMETRTMFTVDGLKLAIGHYSE